MNAVYLKNAHSNQNLIVNHYNIMPANMWCSVQDQDMIELHVYMQVDQLTGTP